ncbi:hypothetical protein [Micromonospora sp. WMMD998]|uniref:hypothetical protein n=1 Tax=Micromonospora sp. WMMD998 TaxID=3016092 RepID=UPI00249C2106|nr:hypothetical protein [Micromonospora sp. WMMD998]WFE38216.1 hypothetical protein O7619_07125 [Micromonospora sp. WMMD998]
MKPLARSAAVVAAGLSGLLLAWAGHIRGLEESPTYLLLAAVLLGVGLIGSTRDLSLADVRAHLSTVLLAVTVGVVLKAALIAAVMYLAFRDPAVLVLGVAVAQIDPLAVAAMSRPDRTSPRARAILSIWASFDDPVTVLLTIYFSAVALELRGDVATTAPGMLGNDPLDLALGFALNLAFAAVAWLLWRLLLAAGLRPGAPVSARRLAVLRWTAVGLLIVLVLVAAGQFLMLGLALAGLFFRPRLGPVVGRSTEAAYLVATFLLGMLLVRGVHLVEGVVLGLAAVAAHMLVSLPLSRNLPTADRRYLAWGQQNGLTAVILALVLERNFPGTVGVVATAIVVINVVHAIATAVLDRARPAGDTAEPAPADPVALPRMRENPAAGSLEPER